MTELEEDEQVESTKPKLSLGVGDRIKAVGAYSILLAFLGIGITIATIFWSSSNANLQNDLRHTQESLAEARAELSQLKSEYVQYRAQAEMRGTDGQGKTENWTVSGTRPTPSAVTATRPTPSPTPQQDQIEVSVDEGKTISLFGDDLLISLVQTSLEGHPFTQKVFATVGSPSKPNAKIEGQDVGYVLTYNGKSKYEIRVTAADTFSAKFLVKRIS